MLNKSRAVAFGVMTGLTCAMAPAPAQRVEPASPALAVEPVLRAGQRFDNDWSALRRLPDRQRRQR